MTKFVPTYKHIEIFNTLEPFTLLLLKVFVDNLGSEKCIENLMEELDYSREDSTILVEVAMYMMEDVNKALIVYPINLN